MVFGNWFSLFPVQDYPAPLYDDSIISTPSTMDPRIFFLFVEGPIMIYVVQGTVVPGNIPTVGYGGVRQLMVGHPLG